MASDKPGSKAIKPPGLASLNRSPSHLLHRALQLALDIYADEFGPGAITQRQYAVLSAVAGHEDPTQTDLVRITGIDRSTLADMAARMIAKGLLERERSAADARANTVRMTDAGREVLAAALPKMQAADTRVLKLLSSGKRDTLTSLLRDLISAADPDAEPTAKADKPKKADKAEKPPKAGKSEKKAKKAKKIKALA
jgi:MarR family transcriptional regulator, temperature-dependent positive regulator of motility